MATYTVSGTTLICTGTDITSAGILNALNSNGLGSGHFGQTSGNKDTYFFNHPIQIGSPSSSGASSVWNCSNQIIKINAVYFSIYGTVQMGSYPSNISTGGGSFVVTGTFGGDQFRLYDNGIFRAYGSFVYAEDRIRIDNDTEFTLIDCDVELEDGVSVGEVGANFGARQQITYDRTRVHHTGAVGIKLYSFNSGLDAPNYSLNKTRVEKCTYGFQLGNSNNLSPILKDVQIDTCTYHIVPNLGNANITFVNPDFTVLRAATINSSDITTLAFRYNFKVQNASSVAIQNAKVFIVDQNNDIVVNAASTDANGLINSHLYNYDGEICLQYATFSGLTKTNREDHTRSAYKYGFLPKTDTVTIDQDTKDFVALLPDASITESNKATVDAYTEIDTSAKFYDRAASYLEDNFGTYLNFIVTRSGSQIDAGSYNISIDATAASAFSISGNTITIKASTFTGDITTTGNVTFLNGAKIVGEVNGEYLTFDGDTITVPYAKIVADTSSSITITLDGITATELEIRGGGTLNVSGTNNAKAYTATLTQTSGTIVLDGDLVPSANYSEDLVNRTITLSGSGTETSLEGLRGLIQVDFETAGTRTNYTSTAQFITQTGSSLIIDADVETLSFASDAPFPNFDYGGTLQLGRKTTFGGVTKYSNGVALIFNRQSSTDFGGSGERALQSSVNGSSFIGYGGELVAAAAVSFCGAVNQSKDGSVLIEKLDFFGRLVSNGNAAQCRFDNNAGQSVVASGITFRSALAANSNDRGIVLFANTFTSFSGRFLSFTLQSFSGQLRGLRFDNLEFAENFRQFDLARNAGGEVLAFVNSDLGSSASIQNVNNNNCHFAFFGEAHISVADTAGTAISTAKYYIADNDDGQRVAPIGDTQDITSLITNYGTSGPNIYSDVVDVNGEATEMIILSTKTGSSVHSDYSNGGSLSDQMDVFVIDYRYNLGSTSVVLRGTGGTDVDFILPEDSLVTEASKATVDAYTTLDTPNEVYDRAKAELVDAYAGETQTTVTRVGSQLDARALDVVIDATAAQAFDLTGNTLTIKSSEYVGDMITTGTITLANGATFTGTRTDANGTVLPLRNVSITGITAGSRLQIYNVTTAAEVVNTTVAGTSYTATYAEGTGYNSGDTVRIRLTQMSTTTAKLSLEATALATDAGWTALISQEDDTVYNAFAVDGSTVTTFTADYANDQVDVVVAANFNISDFYAWWVYNLTTADGIREFFGGITAEDQTNFRINSGILNLFLDNTTTTNIRQLDNRRFYREDLAYPVLEPTTGGGGIDVVWRDKVFSAPTVITGDIADIPTAVQTALTSQGYTNARATRIDTLSTATELNSAQTSIESDIAALNNISSSDVQTAAAAALTAYDAPTKAELDTAQTSIESDIAALNNISSSDVQTAAAAALTAYDAPTKAELDTAQTSIESDIAALNNISSSDVQTAAAAALTAYDAPTKAELDTAQTSIESDIAALNNISSSDVQTAAAAALTAYDAPTKAELDSAQTSIEGNISALNNVSIAEVQTAAANALTAYDAPTKAELDNAQTAIQADIAAQNDISTADIRTELATELTRLDATISSRLAAADYTAPDNAGITAIKNKTDNLTFTGVNLNAVAKVVEDKTGYALTTAEREAIATQVESSILDENDGQKILEAIVTAIGNQNIDELALVAAIRTDLERAGGSLDNLPTLSEIESSTVLAKEASITSLNNLSAAEVLSQATAALATYDAPTKAELDTVQANLESAIAALNNLSAADVLAQAEAALANYDPPTKAELDSVVAALNDISTADVLAQATAALTAYDAPTKTELDNAVAPLSGVATEASLVIINEGVKKASLIIPHTEDL